MESDKAGRKGGMERGPAPNMYPVRKPALLGRGVDTGPLASERWWLAGMVKHSTSLGEQDGPAGGEIWP